MPNEVLISRIDGLRDTYLQKQKAAATLQTVFKAVTNAHSNAQKALREFGAQDMEIDVSSAQQAFARARLKEEAIDPLLPDLRRDLTSLAGLAAALKDAGAALRSEPVDVVRLDKARATLQTARDRGILDLLPELTTELDLAQRSLGDEFGQKLRTALAEQGLTLRGRPPKFEIGRFELDANFAKRSLVLRYGHDIVVPHAPITVEGALRAHAGATRLISGRTQDARAWMTLFHEAYENVRRKRPGAGVRMPIVECYVELVLLRQSRAFLSAPSKRTFADYLRAQFIYDFYEFTNRQRVPAGDRFVKAHVSTKSQTENPARSMWIVEGDTPYDGRYITDVEFVKD